MKHGRPERFESGYCNVFGTWRWFRPERGWRREHAARVFQAIQALAMAWYLGAIWFREAEEERRFAREFEGWEP